MIHKNLRLRDGLSIARKLGLNVNQNNAGEWCIRRMDGRFLRINYNRHDAPQVLVSVLRQVAKVRGQLA